MVNSNTFGVRLTASLIRRVTITSTNQALAFDAIDQLRLDAADGWRRMFLRHARIFALGADAPDVDFRDFKNHLLFPDDASCGGASAKAQCWYRNLVTALSKREWKNASYCAGVLSHYVADAVHPLHTHQSVGDNDIYGALQLSTQVAYRALSRQGAASPSAAVTLVDSADFLAQALTKGARAANAQYAHLLAHFDLMRAVEDPAAGFDAEGRALMAEVIARATNLIAAVFDRAIAEADVAVPDVRLGFTAACALAAWPITGLCNWQRVSARHRTVADMGCELMRRGHLRETLPEEMRVKRDLVEGMGAARAAALPAANVLSFAPRTQPQQVDAGHQSTVKIIEFRDARRVPSPDRQTQTRQSP